MEGANGDRYFFERMLVLEVGDELVHERIMTEELWHTLILLLAQEHDIPPITALNNSIHGYVDDLQLNRDEEAQVRRLLIFVFVRLGEDTDLGHLTASLGFLPIEQRIIYFTMREMMPGAMMYVPFVCLVMKQPDEEFWNYEIRLTSTLTSTT